MVFIRLIVALLAVAALASARAHPLELQGGPRIALSGSYVWDLTLANGITTHWETAPGTAGAVLAGYSEWYQRGKPLGSRRVELETSNEGLLATVERTPAETNAAHALENDTPELDALSEQYNALLDRISGECGSLPDNRQAACSTKYQARVDTLQRQMYAQKDAAAKKTARANAVCTQLRLKLREGRVTGSASNCGQDGEVAVTGTYRPMTQK